MSSFETRGKCLRCDKAALERLLSSWVQKLSLKCNMRPNMSQHLATHILTHGLPLEDLSRGPHFTGTKSSSTAIGSEAPDQVNPTQGHQKLPADSKVWARNKYQYHQHDIGLLEVSDTIAMSRMWSQNFCDGWGPYGMVVLKSLADGSGHTTVSRRILKSSRYQWVLCKKFRLWATEVPATALIPFN